MASKKSNGSVAQIPVLVHPKPPSCILGMGTATLDRIFPMAEFAKTVLPGFGENDTPEVREFNARICKVINIFCQEYLPSCVDIEVIVCTNTSIL